MAAVMDQRILDALKPMLAPQSASWDQPISSEDFQKLLLGKRPKRMEDRWVIRAIDAEPSTGRGSVHLYRSWTGFEDLSATFVLTPGQKSHATFDHITWETSPDRRGGTPDEANAKELIVTVLRNSMELELIEPKP